MHWLRWRLCPPHTSHSGSPRWHLDAGERAHPWHIRCAGGRNLCPLPVEMCRLGRSRMMQHSRLPRSALARSRCKHCRRQTCLGRSQCSSQARRRHSQGAGRCRGRQHSYTRSTAPGSSSSKTCLLDSYRSALGSGRLDPFRTCRQNTAVWSRRTPGRQPADTFLQGRARSWARCCCC